eukprot:TRINITY_DN32440_c0_g1_i1.p1 TRINITY_DN32440_c0_g1~~TRINITY_DN32440_c0_g1_i1.p1  ORF type:complete len:391 (+),score=59.50 TRINITY_DN32440_c0_g1_i1:31-1203(+)
MAESPFSVSGLLDELEKEFADQEEEQTPTGPPLSVPGELGDSVQQRAPLPRSVDDSALNGLLERLEELHDNRVSSTGKYSASAGYDKATIVPFAQAEAVIASAVVRPWAVADDKSIASVISLAQDPNKQFRSYMEDGSRNVDPFLVPGRSSDECWAFFAVYDGHGGREATDYCETRLHEQVLVEMRSLTPAKDAGIALTRAFDKIDSQLAMYGAWNHGTTATVALVHRKKGQGMTLHVANVGDSRAVLLGNSGARRVSTDHRPNDPAEAKRVAAEGGKVVDGRVGADLAISRSLGDHRLKGKGLSCVPDILTCSVACGHVLIIASDGLWDVVTDKDACEVVEACVKRATELECSQHDLMAWLRDNAAQELVDLAKRAGSHDNILAEVIFF